MSDRDPLISHAAAAAYLGVPASTLHQWNTRGVGPRSYRMGRRRNYRYADLDAFIDTKANDARRLAS